MKKKKVSVCAEHFSIPSSSISSSVAPTLILCFHLAVAARQRVVAAAATVFLTETELFNLMAASHGVSPPLCTH